MIPVYKCKKVMNNDNEPLGNVYYPIYVEIHDKIYQSKQQRGKGKMEQSITCTGELVFVVEFNW